MIARTLRTLLLALASAAIAACDKPPTSPVPSTIVIDDSAGFYSWKSVATGTYGSCAIRSDGHPFCWGFEPSGVCSPAGCPVWSRPTPVTGPTPKFDSTTSGAGFYCGLTSTGEAHCWGEGKEFKSRAPVLLTTPPSLVQISADYTSLCVLGADGVVSCSTVEKTMAPVPTTLRFKSIETGVLVSCGIDALNDGYCWGGGYGALGIGSRDSSCAISPSCRSTDVPLVIDGDYKWKSISVGTISACGVTMDNRAYCWGEIRNTNDLITPGYGLLGSGSFTGSTSPVPVAGDMLWKSVTVGTRHACGLTLDGEAYCWGNNLSAEQGIGATGDRSATPRRVVGKLRFESLSADDVTCGLSVNRNIYCWGVTFAGALGNGVLGPGIRSVPTRIISPPPDVLSLSARGGRSIEAVIAFGAFLVLGETAGLRQGLPWLLSSLARRTTAPFPVSDRRYGTAPGVALSKSPAPPVFSGTCFNPQDPACRFADRSCWPWLCSSRASPARTPRTRTSSVDG